MIEAEIGDWERQADPLKPTVAVAFFASVTVTEKLEVPFAVGVPVKFPPPLIVIPCGRLPEVTLQL